MAIEYDEYGNPILQRRRVLGYQVTPGQTQNAASALAANNPLAANLQSRAPAAPRAYVPAGAAGAQGPAGAQSWTSDGNWGKNAANEAAGLSQGLAFGTKFGGVDPGTFLRRAAETGSPLGMLYANAAGGQRENYLGAAGADTLQQYQDAAGRLASGQMGTHAYAPASQALDALTTAGNSQYNLASNAAGQTVGTANGMTPDIGRLRDAAAGAVPSAAEIQARRGVADAIYAQQAQAASARGGNVAAAGRQASAAGSALTSRSLADTAALRANEQAQARQALTQAQSAQGALYNAAGQTANAVGTGIANRASSVAQGRGQVASGVLGSQVTGANALGNVFGAQRGVAQDVVAQDQADQQALINFLLQQANIGQGNAAQIYGADSAAAVQRRAQDFQLLGAGIGAGAAGFAQLGANGARYA